MEEDWRKESRAFWDCWSAGLSLLAAHCGIQPYSSCHVKQQVLHGGSEPGRGGHRDRWTDGERGMESCNRHCSEPGSCVDKAGSPYLPHPPPAPHQRCLRATGTKHTCKRKAACIVAMLIVAAGTGLGQHPCPPTGLLSEYKVEGAGKVWTMSGTPDMGLLGVGLDVAFVQDICCGPTHFYLHDQPYWVTRCYVLVPWHHASVQVSTSFSAKSPVSGHGLWFAHLEDRRLPFDPKSHLLLSL